MWGAGPGALSAERGGLGEAGCHAVLEGGGRWEEAWVQPGGAEAAGRGAQACNVSGGPLIINRASD